MRLIRTAYARRRMRKTVFAIFCKRHVRDHTYSMDRAVVRCNLSLFFASMFKRGGRFNIGYGVMVDGGVLFVDWVVLWQCTDGVGQHLGDCRKTRLGRVS